MLVGGVAAIGHGARRPTEDLDVVVDFEHTNLRRLAVAMHELNARTRTDGYLDAETLELSKALVHEDLIGSTEITTWQTDAGPLDILRELPAADAAPSRYHDLTVRSSAGVVGVAVRLASLDDIIASKRWANRQKDRAALDELEALAVRESTTRHAERRPNEDDVSRPIVDDRTRPTPPGTQPPEPGLGIP
ncbi:hypothetical protein BH20ACT4_BH20ACT4_00370 [soil metagenome]